MAILITAAMLFTEYGADAWRYRQTAVSASVSDADAGSAAGAIPKGARLELKPMDVLDGAGGRRAAVRASEGNLFYRMLESEGPAVLDLPVKGSLGTKAKDRDVIPQEALEEIAALDAALTYETMVALPLDITLRDRMTGEAVQPEGEAMVTLGVPAGMSGRHTAVWRIEGDGAPTPIASSVDAGTISFTTTHFSRYVITDLPAELAQATVLTASDVGKELSAGKVYTITQDVTIDGTAAGTNGLVVSRDTDGDSPAALYIPEGCTLTVIGGTTAAGAGKAAILNRAGDALALYGSGTLDLRGGSGRSVDNGGDQARAGADAADGLEGRIEADVRQASGEAYGTDFAVGGGAGGAGGNGGGGGGAGIGTDGGAGGLGGLETAGSTLGAYVGAGAESVTPASANGTRGRDGKSGTASMAAGAVYVCDEVLVRGAGGPGGAAGQGGAPGEGATHEEVAWTGWASFDIHAAGGGGGGAGGAGGAAPLVGSGGAGGGGGGSGGAGGIQIYDPQPEGEGTRIHHIGSYPAGGGGQGAAFDGEAGQPEAQGVLDATDEGVFGTRSAAAAGGSGGEAGEAAASADGGSLWIAASAKVEAGYRQENAAGGQAAAREKDGAGETAQTYTITFRLQTPPAGSDPTEWDAPEGGKIEATLGLNPNDAAGRAFKPAHRGWRFEGWFTAESGGSRVIDSDGYFLKGASAKGSAYTTQSGAWAWAGDVTLYAQWSPGVFDFELLALTPADQKGTSSGTGHIYLKYDTGWFANQTAVKPLHTIDIPVYPGYVFAGYFTEEGGRGDQVIAPDGSVDAAANLLDASAPLYAFWKVEPKPAQVTARLDDAPYEGAEVSLWQDGEQRALLREDGAGVYVCSGQAKGGVPGVEVGAYEVYVDGRGTGVTLTVDTKKEAKAELDFYTITIDASLDGAAADLSPVELGVDGAAVLELPYDEEGGNYHAPILRGTGRGAVNTYEVYVQGRRVGGSLSIDIRDPQQRARTLPFYKATVRILADELWEDADVTLCQGGAAKYGLPLAGSAGNLATYSLPVLGDTGDDAYEVYIDGADAGVALALDADGYAATPRQTSGAAVFYEASVAVKRDGENLEGASVLLVDGEREAYTLGWSPEGAAFTERHVRKWTDGGGGERAYSVRIPGVAAEGAPGVFVDSERPEAVVECYSVTYMDGADVYLTQTVQRGGLAQEPGSPYHPDLAFAGWYTAPGPAAGEGAGEAYDFATPRGEPLVLYAAYGARAAESGDAAVPLPPGDGAGGEGGAGGTGGLGQAAASGGEGAEAAALEADAAPAYYDWTVLVDTKLDGAPADCEEVRLVPVGADGPAAGKVLGKDGTGAYKDTIRTASAEGGEEKYEVWVDGEPSGKTVRYAEGPDNYAEVSRWTVRVRTLAGGEPASAPGAGTLRAYGQGELDELALRQVSVGVYEKVYFEKKTLPFLADITYRVYFDGKDTGLDVAFSEEGREASLELELPAAPDDRVRSGAAPGGQGAEDAAGGARDARDAGGTAGENAGGGEDAGGTAGEGAGDAGESGTGAADAPRKATVTFETGGHGAYTPSERIVAVGKPLAADARSLDPGADEAYDFGGWYQDAACTQGYLWDVEEDPVRGDMTLYAKWTIKRHEVLFDMGAAGPGEGGAAAAETQTVNHGGLAARPQADPTAAGLVFTGWYKDGACTAPWDFSADTVTDATTIYAGWAEDADALPAEDPAPDAEAPAVTLNAGWPGALFAVRFEMNEHGAQIEPIYAYAGEALDAPVPVPHETGWTFGGWYTDKACSAESRWTFGDGGFRMPSGDLTLYAKWAVNTWGVDYLPNGHGGGSIFDVLEDVPFGTRLREPIKDPADDEYLFLGWYKDPSCAPGTEWVFADDTTPDRDLKLYAGWRAKDAVEVKYDLNGQEGRVPSTWLVPGQTIPAPAAPSAPGYAFGGWFKDKSCSDSKVWNFESEKVPEGGVTLYAKWVSMEVPLEAPAEGATEAPAEGLAEAPVEAPEAEGQAEAPVAAPEAEAMAAARVQMQTALLLPEPVPRVASSMPEAYTVHYDGNGHGEAPADKTALSGLPMPAAPSPDPTEEGWVFTGWYKDQTCTVPWDFKNDVTPELPGTGKVVVCFAGWAPEGSGFVRFNLNGHGEGDAPATQAVPAGGWAEEPVPAPHEDGWTFTGWHTGWRTDVAAAWDFSANTMSDPARTITLYAGWELNRYKVYYDLQGRGVGTEPINPTITFGEAVARPAGDPVAAGWVFMGWYQDPSCSDGAEWVFKDGTYGAGGTGGVPGTMPAHDLRLYAKWRSTSAHAVTFVAGGAAETPPEQYLSVGDWVSEPVPAPVATAEGYTFSGWYRSETFEEASQWNFLVNRMPDADLTLYALFQSASGEPLQSGAPNGEAQASLALPVSFGWEDVPRYSGAGDVLQKGSSAAAGPEPLEIPGFPELQAFPVLQAFPELQAFPGPGLSDISARR